MGIVLFPELVKEKRFAGICKVIQRLFLQGCQKIGNEIDPVLET